MATSHGDTTLTPPSTPPTPTMPATPRESSTGLSDVFSTSRSPSPTTQHRFSTQHPTDIPRLRTTHVTAGYRDGLSASREAAVQPGFDEGYPLGATFGLRVGYLLGVLEGMIAAGCDDSRSNGRGDEQGQGGGTKRLRVLLGQARKELCVQGVFGQGVWKSDGTWGYIVPGEIGEGDNVTWRQIVDAHPLIQKWEGIVEEEVKLVGLTLGTFEGPEWEAGRIPADNEG